VVIYLGGVAVAQQGEWGAEIQISWEPCADRWKMCTCQKNVKFLFVNISKSSGCAQQKVH